MKKALLIVLGVLLMASAVGAEDGFVMIAPDDAMFYVEGPTSGYFLFTGGKKLFVEINSGNERYYHTNFRITEKEAAEVAKVNGVAYTHICDNGYYLWVKVAKLFVNDWDQVQEDVFKVLCK